MAQQKIETLHRLYLLCAALCLGCGTLSILLFWKFRIRRIFNVRTGRSMKKAVKKKEKTNRETEPPEPGDQTEDLAGKLKQEDPSAGNRETEFLKRSFRGYDIIQAQAETDESYGKFILESGVMVTHVEEGR